MSACPRDARLELTADQQAVVKAAEDYAAALKAGDYGAMWDLLSRNSQEWVARNLEGEGGIRAQVADSTTALEKGGLDDAKRREHEHFLKRMPKPTELKTMDARAYYVWQLKQSTTDTQKVETARLFSFENVREVIVPAQGPATLVLKTGDPERYTFVRQDGSWRLELSAAKLKELDAIRQKEHDERAE